MKNVNWTWVFPNEDSLRIPTLFELIKFATELLFDVRKSNHNEIPVYWLECGGFRAYKDNKTDELWLEFECKY